LKRKTIKVKVKSKKVKVREENSKSQAPNNYNKNEEIVGIKHQAPSTKLQTSSKHQ
jgi:hypothetical protein